MQMKDSDVPRRERIEAMGCFRWKWSCRPRTERNSKADKASVANHLIQSITHGTTQSDSPRSSTPSLWHEAISLYIQELPTEDQQSIISMRDDAGLTPQSLEALFAPLMQEHKRGKVTKLLLKFGSTLRHVRSFATIVDVAVQSHPNVGSLIWGGIRLILEISSRTLELLSETSNLFDRLSSYLPIFETWARLFPRADYGQLSDCLTKTYLEYIHALVKIIKFLRRSGLGNIVRATFSPSFHQQFQDCERRIKDVIKLLALEVQTAGIRSSMQRDKEIANLLAEKPGCLATDSAIPLPIRFPRVLPRNDRYHERGLEMERVTTLLRSHNADISSIALCGFVGCGKSAIATEYVQRNMDLYDAVMFFNAGDGFKLERQYAQLARNLGFAAEREDVGSSREFVLTWFSSTDLRLLIVFDNANDRSVLRAFWPATSDGTVIVTSRDPFVKEKGLASESVQVRSFTVTEGAHFLLSFLERPAYTAAEDQAAATVIAEHFSGWPMGLRITAAFIKDKRLTPARFVRLHKETETAYKIQQANGYNGPPTVASLWNLALSDIPHEARDLLDVLCLLDPDEIPIDFADMPTFQFLDAREWLSSRSLISYDECQDFISMDRSFQNAWLDTLMENPDRYGSAFGNALNSLLEAVPKSNFQRPRDPELWGPTFMYVSHVASLEQHSRRKLDQKHAILLLRLIIRCVHVFLESGGYQAGFDQITNAESLANRHDVTDPEVLSSLLYVHGRLATETNQLSLSVDCFARALDLFRRGLTEPEDQIPTGSKIYLSRLYSCFGISLTAVSHFAKAEEYHMLALTNVLKIESSARLGTLYSNLGSCLLWKGDYYRAENVLHNALLRHDRELQCNMYALGNVYLKQGRLEDALDIHREVLESYSTMLGHSHHTVADSCHKVGSIYALAGFTNRDLHQAELFLRKALDIYGSMQRRGKNYMESSIARTEWKLAKILQARSDYTDTNAALMVRRALDFLQTVTKCNKEDFQDDDQIEQAFDSLLFFWSR